MAGAILSSSLCPIKRNGIIRLTCMGGKVVSKRCDEWIVVMWV